jgi:hypothetical protein
MHQKMKNPSKNKRKHKKIMLEKRSQHQTKNSSKKRKKRNQKMVDKRSKNQNESIH